MASGAHSNFSTKKYLVNPSDNWFHSYYEYQLHYAKIAEKTDCKMLIIGCELVQTERKEEYWRS